MGKVLENCAIALPFGLVAISRSPASSEAAFGGFQSAWPCFTCHPGCERSTRGKEGNIAQEHKRKTAASADALLSRRFKMSFMERSGPHWRFQPSLLSPDQQGL